MRNRSVCSRRQRYIIQIESNEVDRQNEISRDRSIDVQSECFFSSTQKIILLFGKFKPSKAIQPTGAERYSRNYVRKSDRQPAGRRIDHQQIFCSRSPFRGQIKREIKEQT
jgi:hypothetical protein